MVLRPGQKRALDPSAHSVAASVLEDDNLTRLILGSIGGPWEWSPWDSASCEAAKALLYATATNKRWYRLAGLNDVWKQIVAARWPAAADLSVQSFKQFYRSHHLALREGDLPPLYREFDAPDATDFQFIVDLGVDEEEIDARHNFLSVVLDGGQARPLDNALFRDENLPGDPPSQGLCWTVQPHFDSIMRDDETPRDAFLRAFNGSQNCVVLTLTAFRKSDQRTSILRDTMLNPQLVPSLLDDTGTYSRADLPAGSGLTGKMASHRCFVRFGCLASETGDVEEPLTWVFGFDFHEAEKDPDVDILASVDVWRALTLVDWT